jgi:hypothetical protein
MGDLFILVAIDVAGLFVIWFVLRARVRKTLELEGILAEARKEIRLLSIEINETTDRNVTLVEDRLGSLRELLAEADRRMGVMKRETARRQDEREVYNRLGKRVPLASGSRAAPDTLPFGEPLFDLVADAITGAAAGSVTGAAADIVTDSPGGATRVVPPVRTPSSGTDRAKETRSVAADVWAVADRAPADREPVKSGPARTLPELLPARESVIPPPSLRERALELHRGGFSADIIAARLGATVSEIDLLVSLEEGRRGHLEGDVGFGGGGR